MLLKHPIVILVICFFVAVTVGMVSVLTYREMTRQAPPSSIGTPALPGKDTANPVTTPQNPSAERPWHPVALVVRDYIIRIASITISENQVSVLSITEKQWPDACLGVRSEDEMCAQVITPGYEVTMQVGSETQVYHTNSDGSVLRLFSTVAVLPPPNEGPQVPDISNIHKSCKQNSDCGYMFTCVSYYGIAGPSGPQFSTCEIPCSDASQCPAQTWCTTIADGPGQVCDYDTR